MNRSAMLDGFGERLLRRIGEDPLDLPTGYNPRMLAEGACADLEEIEGFSR